MERINTVSNHFKNTITLILLIHLLDSVICTAFAQNQNGSQYGGGKYLSNKGEGDTPVVESWKVTDSDDKAHLYADLIRIFEELTVLSGPENVSVCVTLQKIVREVSNPDTDDNSKQVGVYLYFKEVILDDNVSNTNVNVNKHKDMGCVSKSSFHIVPGLSSMSMKQGTSETNSTKNYENKPGTNISGAVHASREGNGTNKKDKGLSRTQVVVIATCSAVIGTFFIIAGALRISSCVKRYRSNREAAEVLARRESSMNLNVANLSTGNLRRDSASSKASRQSNTIIKGGSDLQVARHDRAHNYLSHNSPPMHNTEHKPLLPVYATNQCSEAGSSHGSIAFIDDESSSRAKNNDASTGSSDGQSEDDPLLRKSPDSGSYVEINMENAYNGEGGSVTSSREIFEPGVGEDPENTVDDNDDYNIDDIEDNSVDDNDYDISDTEPEHLVKPEVGTSPECIDISDEDMLSEPDTHKSTSRENLSNSCENESNCSANGERCPTINGMENNIKDCFVITTGLNQSNNSISNNPSYSYGNQSEYWYEGYDGEYGNTEYPYTNNYINYNDTNMNDHNDQVLTTTLGLNNDICNNTHMNGDGNGIQANTPSPCALSEESLNISKDSSGEPLAEDNLATFETDIKNTSDTSQSMVVPHIVPLAEYHKQVNAQSMDLS